MFGKLKEIIGLGEYDEEFDELDDAEEEEKNQIEPIIQNTHGTKVVNIHSNNKYIHKYAKKITNNSYLNHPLFIPAK